MEQSDKVARTVDKYIRHRFSDEKAEEQQKHLHQSRQIISKPPQIVSQINLPSEQLTQPLTPASTTLLTLSNSSDTPTAASSSINSASTPSSPTTPTTTITATIPTTTTESITTLSTTITNSFPVVAPSCSIVDTTTSSKPTHIFLKPKIPGTRPHAIPIEMLPKSEQSIDIQTLQSITPTDSNKVPDPIQVPSSVTVIDTQLPSAPEGSMKPPKIALFTLEHTSAVCAQVRDDLKYIAIGLENSQICLWSLNYTNLTLTIEDKVILVGHSGPVYCIVFLKNGLMISSSEDSTIRLWCLKTLGNICIYHGHNYPVWVLEPSPLGGMFASGSMDGTSKIWSYDSITPIRILSGHDKDVEFIKFHPNERYVATGSCDKTVRMWSIVDGRMVRVMVGHKDRIVGISFLPDGQFLATASADGCIKIWVIKENLIKSEIIVPPIRSIAFNFEQNFVSCCGVDNALRLWYFNSEHMVDKTIYDKQITNNSYLFNSCFTPAEFNILFAFEYI